MIVIDASRALVSWRASRKLWSAALASNALHFSSDLLGSAAVLVGLLFVRAGYHDADSIAALIVAALVLVAATRLMRTNVDVLMDRVPVEAEAAARAAIAGITPLVDLKRLRMREAGGRQFADVVIGVPPGAAVGQGHAAADQVEEAVQTRAAAERRRRARRAGGGARHPRPRTGRGSQRRSRSRGAQHQRAALDGGVEVSLHLKLPGDLPLEEAHEVAEQVELAIRAAVPAVTAVQTHLEPLTEDEHVRTVEDGGAEAGDVRRIVREEVGREPRELRFLQTTKGSSRSSRSASTPARRSRTRTRARARSRRASATSIPSIADVIVHTEP